MQKRMLFNLLSVLLGIYLFSACEYVTITPEPPVPPKPGDSTSFSLKVQPIFNGGCNKSGCHMGTVAPDLRDGKAWQSLMDNSCVVPGNGAGSLLYTILQPGQSMSVYGNPTDNATIKQWINEGAKNN